MSLPPNDISSSSAIVAQLSRKPNTHTQTKRRATAHALLFIHLLRQEDSIKNIKKLC